jgi:hypothetical protein
MFYRSALILGLCLTKKRKTLEFKTGTKPCGEIINGRQPMLSIADVVASKICTDEIRKAACFCKRLLSFLTKKFINQNFITLNNPKYMSKS